MAGWTADDRAEFARLHEVRGIARRAHAWRKIAPRTHGRSRGGRTLTRRVIEVGMADDTVAALLNPTRHLKSRWAALPVLLAGAFMVVLDFFIVNVALRRSRPISGRARARSNGSSRATASRSRRSSSPPAGSAMRSGAGACTRSAWACSLWRRPRVGRGPAHDSGAGTGRAGRGRGHRHAPGPRDHRRDVQERSLRARAERHATARRRRSVLLESLRQSIPLIHRSRSSFALGHSTRPPKSSQCDRTEMSCESSLQEPAGRSEPGSFRS
jgi:hypothetical protein